MYTLFTLINVPNRGSIPKNVAIAILYTGIPQINTLWNLCEKSHHTLAMELLKWRL